MDSFVHLLNDMKQLKQEYNLFFFNIKQLSIDYFFIKFLFNIFFKIK